MRIFLVAILVLGTPGCTKKRKSSDSGGAASTGPKRPLQVTWSKDAAGNQEGKLEGGGAIETSGFRGTYHVTVRDVERGRWKLGEQSGELQSSYTLIDLPILATLGERTWDELQAVDPKATLELELADGRAGSVALPAINLTYMVEEKLKDAESSPVLFGQEPDDPNKKDSLFWPGAASKKHFGKAGKLHELDWVLMTRAGAEERGRKVCTGYKDSKDKPTPDVDLVLKDTVAVIYDRRTGDVVDKKTFPPNEECPMFTFRAAGETKEDSTPPYQAIEAWAREKVGR